MLGYSSAQPAFWRIFATRLLVDVPIAREYSIEFVIPMQKVPTQVLLLNLTYLSHVINPNLSHIISSDYMKSRLCPRDLIQRNRIVYDDRRGRELSVLVKVPDIKFSPSVDRCKYGWMDRWPSDVINIVSTPIERVNWLRFLENQMTSLNPSKNFSLSLYPIHETQKLAKILKRPKSNREKMELTFTFKFQSFKLQSKLEVRYKLEKSIGPGTEWESMPVTGAWWASNVSKIPVFVPCRHPKFATQFTIRASKIYNTISIRKLRSYPSKQFHLHYLRQSYWFHQTGKWDK